MIPWSSSARRRGRCCRIFEGHRSQAPRSRRMIVFLDFEASSLSKHSYPIEVGWVFADGREEAHLIRPAPGWVDWDPRAQAIHGIERAALERDGTPHDQVARRMIEILSG